MSHYQLHKKDRAPRSCIGHSEWIQTIFVNNCPQPTSIETRKPWSISRQWNKLEHNLISAFFKFLIQSLYFHSSSNEIAYWKTTTLLPSVIGCSSVSHSVGRDPISFLYVLRIYLLLDYVEVRVYNKSLESPHFEKVICVKFEWNMT
jgi:hypothetical protein